jgi:hypothetical protein
VPFNTVGIGPIPSTPPIRYSPTLQATGLTFTGTNSTYPTYESYYVKQGYLVSFWIQVDLTTVTNFGTGQIKLELPYDPHTATMNHFSAWCWYDPSNPADTDPGHVVLQADHFPGSKVLDIHWYGAATATPKPVNEQLFTSTSPFTLTTASKIYVNGTYFTDTL